MRSQHLLSLFVPVLSRIEEGVVVADAQGAVLYHNPAVEALLGEPGEEALRDIAHLGGLDLAARLAGEGVTRCVAKETDGACDEFVQFEERIRVGGEDRWLHFCSGLVDLPKGEGKVRLMMIQDYTDHRRVEAVLKEKTSCGLITNDPDMLELIERVRNIARTEASVMLQGESGTGKTELARVIHKRSKRSGGAFVEVNCGAIPAALIESELFGHVRGAFTGAVSDRQGRFAAADGGTLFLDEIGDLPLELQAKLLKVLQDGRFEPVGSDRTLQVDVRVICASNADLRAMVDEGLFRPDLYYRLAVIPLFVPPLRERPGDIPLLIEHFGVRLAARGYPLGVKVDPQALRVLMDYPWPGNLRELANAVEHGIICAVDGSMMVGGLPQHIRDFAKGRGRSGAGRLSARIVEQRAQIEEALRKANGVRANAAAILGVDRSTLWRRMRKLGLK